MKINQLSTFICMSICMTEFAYALPPAEGMQIVAEPDYIIPNPFDKRVAPAVAKAVAEAAKKTGVARI